MTLPITYDARRGMRREILSLVQEHKQRHPKVGALGLIDAPVPTGPVLADYIVDPLGHHPLTHIPNPKIFWSNMGNNNIGDCDFASLATITNASDIGLGKRPSVSQRECTRAYWAYCRKYNGGKDVGAWPLQVLMDWMNAPLFGSKLVAYANAPESDIETLKSYIFHFGGVSTSVTLYDSTVAQFRSGAPWVPTVPLTSDKMYGGHQISLIGYDESYFYAETWGRIVKIAPEWLALLNYGGYVTWHFVFITPAVAIAKAFRHVNLPALIGDLEKAI